MESSRIARPISLEAIDLLIADRESERGKVFKNLRRRIELFAGKKMQKLFRSQLFGKKRTGAYKI